MLKKRYYLYLQEKTYCWTVRFARLLNLLKILFHIFIQQGWLISNEIGNSTIFRFQKYGIELSRWVLLLDTYDVDDKMDSEDFLKQKESDLGFWNFRSSDMLMIVKLVFEHYKILEMLTNTVSPVNIFITV